MTVRTSGHALSCLLHLLIASPVAWAGMAEDSDPLGSRRSPTDDAAAFYMWRCEINLLFLLVECENFVHLNYCHC